LYLHIEQAIAAAADALGTELGALEGRIDDLAVEDIAGLAGELSSLEEAIAALNALTGEDGAIDDRLTELEDRLAGINDTVVAYVDAEIAAVEALIEGLQIDDIGGLTAKLSQLDAAIASLEGASDSLSDLVGQPATGEDDATGLYLHIEQAIAAAADALGTE